MKIKVIAIIILMFVTDPKGLVLEEFEIGGREETIQTTA